MKKQTLVLSLVLSAALGVEGVVASEVTGLIAFSPGTPARASEVNANFAAVETAVDDNDDRIAALEAEIAGLQDTVSQLQASLAALNASDVMALNPYLAVEAPGGVPRAVLSGVNLHVVNGQGRTDTANGLGNIIIGYDEPREFDDLECSLGTDPDTFQPVTNETECTNAGGTWALNHKSGSHYLVVGPRHNYSRWGGEVVGLRNTSNFDFASVSGGRSNTASGWSASVSGGFANTASGIGASVSGGERNTAGAFSASVSGGLENTASGSRASVSGGEQNTAGADSSSVSGGTLNSASGPNSAVSGGQSNTAGGWRASVSGGAFRSASGNEDWAAGGLFQDN